VSHFAEYCATAPSLSIELWKNAGLKCGEAAVNRERSTRPRVEPPT